MIKQTSIEAYKSISVEELVKLGLIVEKGKQKCPLTSRTVTVWGLR